MVDFVVESNLPFNTIHQPSLQRLLELVSKRKIEMLATKFFMNSLKDRYEVIRAKIIELLKEQTYICSTADVWSSRAQAYIGITVHYLTPTFDRKSFLLAFRQLKEKQTHEVLAKVINDVLKEFELPVHKITHIVTDGGSAFCKAFKRFGRQHDAHVENVLDETSQSESMPFIQNEDGETW